MSEYRINIDNIFAGPLDLLLYLVRKDEVDIYDIPISNITKQYLEYVDMLKSLDLDIAGDFLVMAATLMEIKSAMLLPRAKPEDGEDEEDSDPRSDLIRQLLEYKKFKDAAALLNSKQQQQELRHSRPDSIISNIKQDQEPELDLEEVSIWNLLETFDTLMKQTGRYQDYSEIEDETPIDVYQVEILERLQFEGPMTFEHIFQGRENRLVMVGLFLALLELVRHKLIWTEQSDHGVIYLKALSEDPAEEAVQNAILANEKHLASVAARMGGSRGEEPDDAENENETAESDYFDEEEDNSAENDSDLDDLAETISDQDNNNNDNLESATADTAFDDDNEDDDDDEFLQELNGINVADEISGSETSAEKSDEVLDDTL